LQFWRAEVSDLSYRADRAAIMYCYLGLAEVDDLGYKAYDAIEKL